MGNRFYR